MLFTFLLYLQDSSVSMQKAAFGQLEEILNLNKLDEFVLQWCYGLVHSRLFFDTLLASRGIIYTQAEAVTSGF